MELKSLRHFVALVEHQGFARAGEAIGLSQPALSRSIQTLEQRLDCDLINRRQGGRADAARSTGARACPATARW